MCFFSQGPFHKCVHEWKDVHRLWNQVSRAWWYLDLFEEMYKKEIFLFYVSVSEIDFYQYLGGIDINSGHFIFSRNTPRKSHLWFKFILGQFCTSVENESCLPALLLWNSLSFPQNQGKNCAPESDSGELMLLPVLPVFSDRTLCPQWEQPFLTSRLLGNMRQSLPSSEGDSSWAGGLHTGYHGNTPNEGYD